MSHVQPQWLPALISTVTDPQKAARAMVWRSKKCNVNDVECAGFLDTSVESFQSALASVTGAFVASQQVCQQPHLVQHPACDKAVSMTLQVLNL